MTPKETYIDEQITKTVQFWNDRLLALGILLFLLLGIMDYIATPENFRTFMMYRITASAALAILFYLNRHKKHRMYHYAIITAMIVISAATIELMILKFGGHASHYYAGLNLLIIGALGLIPFSLPLSLSVSILIYAIYIIPILLFDRITDVPTFIVNNAFMISTFSISLTWRISTQRGMLNELSLQYDLTQQRRMLERYSERLEQDVAERTSELQKSEQWHRSLFDNATDGILVLDRNGIIVNANERACDMHGFTRDFLLGTHIKLLEQDGHGNAFAERIHRILAGEALVFETTHNKKDGSPLQLEISSKAIAIGDELYIQSFYRDVTEKKKLREHLVQSQKMESIGVLAGGIAHDFNNILTAILGHTEILRLDTSLVSRSLRSLQVIEDVSIKAGGMISKLLGFARKSTYEMLPLNVNKVILDTVNLTERMLGVDIKLNLDLVDILPDIHGDLNQLEQVIMNLIVNARDAMPKGGRIDISTRYCEATDGMKNAPPYVQTGQYVQVAVADTGMGIPDHVIQKIFEPFFTTKETGRGTGLGLSMVYGAVKEHGGYIHVQSQVGCGSTFTMYFPIPVMAVSRPVKTKEVPIKRDEIILYVDDQEEALWAFQEILEQQGYTVLSANDPAQALALFKKQRHEIALVITDMIMPKIDGLEFIRQIRARNPELKVLAVSGDLNIIRGKDSIPDVAGFIRKPFDSGALVSTIRRILDTKPSASAPFNA